ncbi:MAG: hypothetical protein JW744_02030 [Candidatus Diapherotrites archaeon]|uniref:Exonuclease SbcC n=1 Tax=Candidatus Iainarchaeum sp. TaxID=3101447 RepID=A0A938YN50_9ARCH|nr:hypothetical protein [Candidatus Diapherotrites archaeon]
MGFFQGIFSKKAETPAKVNLSELNAFMASETGQQGKALEVAVAGKLSEVKHLLNELRSGIEKLKSSDSESGNKRLEKIVSTAKGNAERQLASLIQKLEPPASADLSLVSRYCSSAGIILQQEINHFGKNIAYTSISFKQEIKHLGLLIRQLQSVFSEMQSSFSSAKHFSLSSSIDSMASGLGKKIQSTERLEREISEIGESAASANGQLQALQAKLASLRESPAFRKISGLNEEKAGLLHSKQLAKTETIDLFSKIDKPLHRMQGIVRAGKFQISSELALLLDELLKNPFNALRRDPKAEKLKRLLKEVQLAIEQGLIELKDREREKRLSALQELISFDFFGQCFWKFNEIDSKLAALEKELNALPARKQEEQLLKSLNDAKKGLQAVQESLGEKKALLKQLQGELPGLKQKLETAVSDAAGKKVELQI